MFVYPRSRTRAAATTRPNSRRKWPIRLSEVGQRRVPGGESTADDGLPALPASSDPLTDENNWRSSARRAEELVADTKTAVWIGR